MAKDRIPPHNSEAETAILGAILIDKDAIAELTQKVKTDYFYDPIHQDIFSAMVDLYEARKPIDVLSLSNELKKKNLLQRVGGGTFLTSLATSVPTSAHVEHYAEIVKDAYIRRRLITIGKDLTEMAFVEGEEASIVLDQAEQQIFQISDANTKQGFIHIKETLAESFDKLDEIQKRGDALRGLETGFVDLDFMLSGLQQSNLVIIAARPGQGKTAFMVNIAQHIAVNTKIPVGIFSLEMSKEELVDRLLVSQANIDAWKLKTGKLHEEDFEKLSMAMGELADAPIFIDDTPGITVSEIRTKARRLQAEHGVKLIIVDYLQLVNPGKKIENRVQEVSYISQNMKNLARELRIPVIAASQLSRAVEQRSGGKPQLADLRESGAIEQDADVVMFLYAKEEEFTPERVVNILVAKHRNGPVGEKELLFKGDRIRFYNLERASAAN